MFQIVLKPVNGYFFVGEVFLLVVGIFFFLGGGGGEEVFAFVLVWAAVDFVAVVAAVVQNAFFKGLGNHQKLGN